jgi:hypothetical protein
VVCTWATGGEEFTPSDLQRTGSSREDVRADAVACKSSRSGSRTRTGVTSHRILNQDGSCEIAGKYAVSQERAARGAAPNAEDAPPDSDLALVTERWPTLPSAIKAAILALIGTGPDRTP